VSDSERIVEGGDGNLLKLCVKSNLSLNYYLLLGDFSTFSIGCRRSLSFRFELFG